MRTRMLIVVCGLLSVASAEEWDLDPNGWEKTECGFQSREDGFAVVTPTKAYRKIVLRGKVTPVESTGGSWALMGLAVYADGDHYWHLTLVRSPDGLKVWELAEMCDGRWGTQGSHACAYDEKLGGWDFGKTYDLKLELDADAISGEVSELGSKRVVYRASFVFGKEPGVRAGVPALRVRGGMKGRVEGLSVKMSGAADPRKGAGVRPYVACAPVSGVKGNATGFFHVEQKNGRDWIIDPKGNGLVVRGCDQVQPDGPPCEALGYSPYARTVSAAFQSRKDWAKDAIGKLQSWGFNTLGAGCATVDLKGQGLAHTYVLNIGDRLGYMKDDLWISKGRNAPCTAFPNVFHPEFERLCDWWAREKCAAHAADPWLLGYFLDNELCWWGTGNRAEGLFDAVAEKPETHPAKIELVKFLAGRKANGRIKREFLYRVARRYFSVAAAAVRKHDPNHLILGCRFAGFDGADPVVWKAAGEFCDVVSVNCYPWVDLPAKRVYEKENGRPFSVRFQELQKTAARPMLVSEWSFPALETGCPCTHGAGQRLATQAERVKASELFVKTMMDERHLVGYDYFMWVDQPTEGVSRAFPENSNYGLVRDNGGIYAELTEMFRRVHLAKGRRK